MTNSYDLSQFMPKTFSEALKNGFVSFSSIDALANYLKQKEVKEMPLEQIIGDIGLGEYGECSVDLEKVFGSDYKSKSKKVLTTISYLYNKFYKNAIVKLDELESIGLQVDLMMFKDSGKLAYSGVVSLGSARPWDDNFMDVVCANQNLIIGDVNDYSLVVSDTALNYNDPNYQWCCKRLRK